jgi:hypothetical protein
MKVDDSPDNGKTPRLGSSQMMVTRQPTLAEASDPDSEFEMGRSRQLAAGHGRTRKHDAFPTEAGAGQSTGVKEGQVALVAMNLMSNSSSG